MCNGNNYALMDKNKLPFVAQQNISFDRNGKMRQTLIRIDNQVKDFRDLGKSTFTHSSLLADIQTIALQKGVLMKELYDS